MTRTKTIHAPGLPAPVVGWIYNHATKNFWRVASWYELDDLVQDGLMKAYGCLERYGIPGVDIDPPHFMALVKSAFHNHIGDLLRHSRPEQELTSHVGDMAADNETEGGYLDRASEPESPAQELAAFISGMPEALRRAVLLYLNTPEKLRPRRVHLEDDTTFEAKILQRLAGFPKRFDFETELRAYIWESNNLDPAIA